MKKLAVMQPYIFPYLGYFQLIHAVDEFIFLDDANFIKGGYINRNSLLLDGRAHRFALPVQDISSFRTIRDHQYAEVSRKFFELLEHAYRKAPFFDDIYTLIFGVLSSPNRSVAAVNRLSIETTMEYLGLRRVLNESSSLDSTPTSKGLMRVINVCKQQGASIYINAPGGRSLYDPLHFKSQGLSLGFVEPHFSQYSQKTSTFVAGLSIIDLLMWNSPEEVTAMLRDYSVEFPSNF